MSYRTAVRLTSEDGGEKKWLTGKTGKRLSFKNADAATDYLLAHGYKKIGRGYLPGVELDPIMPNIKDVDVDRDAMLTLCETVLRQAIKDYRACLASIKQETNPDKLVLLEAQAESFNKFFEESPFIAVYNLDPGWIRNRVKKGDFNEKRKKRIEPKTERTKRKLRTGSSDR